MANEIIIKPNRDREIKYEMGKTWSAKDKEFVYQLLVTVDGMLINDFQAKTKEEAIKMANSTFDLSRLLEDKMSLQEALSILLLNVGNVEITEAKREVGYWVFYFYNYKHAKAFMRVYDNGKNETGMEIDNIRGLK